MQFLIVEDETKVAGFIRQALEEEGHSVELAADGGEGFRLAMTVDYDLVILDLLLPERDGLEICRDLRASGRCMPILMLTARGALQDKVTGLDMGADDYLTKPFAVAELLARCRALLRRGSVSAPPVLTVGDLELSAATHQARRRGRSVALSAREFALLEYLMRNAGRVISREMILEHVWGFDFEGGRNVVDVYINYLRNKIDKDEAVKLIRTVRGFGFRIGGDDAG
jgi:DNA-binding response OmpR family regulator